MGRESPLNKHSAVFGEAPTVVTCLRLLLQADELTRSAAGSPQRGLSLAELLLADVAPAALHWLVEENFGLHLAGGAQEKGEARLAVFTQRSSFRLSSLGLEFARSVVMNSPLNGQD